MQKLIISGIANLARFTFALARLAVMFIFIVLAAKIVWTIGKWAWNLW